MTVDFEVSNAKVKTWRRCPKKYEFKYVKKLKAKKRGLPLELGSWVHDLLMCHFDGNDWRELHEEKSKEFYSLFEEEREHLGDLPNAARRLVRNYLLTYRIEIKREKTIDTEIDETIELPNGLKFRFIIDKIYETRDGRRWLKDYKTGKKFLPSDFMLLDAQLTRYFYCAEKMGYGPLAGIEFDQIITVPPTKPKLIREDTALEQRQNIRCDVFTYLEEIKRHGFDVDKYKPFLARLKARNDQWFRRTQLPRDLPLIQTMMSELVMSSREMMRAERREEFPRTPAKECTWDCEFLEPCMLQAQGADISHVLKAGYTRKGEDS